MRVLMTSIEKFASKKGINYVKGSFLNLTSGIVGNFITTQEKFDAFGFDERKVLTKEDLSEIVEKNEESDIQFDQNGRLDSLS